MAKTCSNWSELVQIGPNWLKLAQIGLNFYYLFIFSSWAEMETHLIGHFPIFPLTLSAKQVFILQFLQPLAEYQVESIQDLKGKKNEFNRFFFKKYQFCT